MAKRGIHSHWENSVLSPTHKMQTLSFLGLFSPTILPKLSLLLNCSLLKLNCLWRCIQTAAFYKFPEDKKKAMGKDY